MKKAMKKLMAALLAVAMVCAMAIPAWADGGATHSSSGIDGTITIDNAVKDQTYKIYRILDLQYNDVAKSFRYVKNTKWGTFVGEQTLYLTVDANGVVTWTNTDNADNGAAIKALAVAAGQYVKDNTSLTDDGSVKATSSTVKFTGLPLGWYLVVSDLTTDAICSIDTTAKDVTIKEKNGAPTVEKEVEYASGSFGQGNDGNVGDIVNFQTTIYVTDGDPTNYVLHDKMSNGLAFKEDSIVVKKNGERFTDYTVVTPTDNCTFEIKFNENSLQANDTVVVTYSAIINSNAVVGTAGNDNETWLKYGNNGETTHGKTKTYTWKFDILKYFTDSNNDMQYLANVEFVLYRKDNTANKTEYAQFNSNNKLTGWTEAENEATKLKTNATSTVAVEGLDAGTYFLKETATPVGFNSLTSDVEVQITSSCNTLTHATYTVQYKMVNEEDFTDTGDEKVVPIENKRGTTLPGTGGIGTTIFYVIGGGLMVAAAILLITKKRMENR
ncbi:MAG: isopeptide-forming domain-containing fimbrial protein [Faecalibacterium prausnitzii]|nr:isopeptide-forming domain-containing fimbrial protein [Faecalibacterium prausnitzii]